MHEAARQAGTGQAAASQRHPAQPGSSRVFRSPPNPSSLFQVPLLEERGSTPMLAHIAWNWALRSPHIDVCVWVCGCVGWSEVE